MQLEVKIQSISDLITNSSSEVFSIYSDLPKNKVEDLLESVHNKFDFKGSYSEFRELSEEERKKYDNYSGEGGVIEVETFEDSYQYDLRYIPENKKHLYTREIHAMYSSLSVEELQKRLTVRIDQGFYATINWMIENLYVVEVDANCVKNEKGRVIKLLPWGEDSYVVDENGNKIRTIED